MILIINFIREAREVDERCASCLIAFVVLFICRDGLSVPEK